MNSWFLTGEILKHGIKGTQYKTLWLQVNISSPSAEIQGNKIFINFPIDGDKTSKKGRISDAVISKLDTHKFVFVNDAMIVPVTVGKKNQNGEWDNKEVPGVRANIVNLFLSKDRYDDLNYGTVHGTVSKYNNSGGFDKYIIEERYRNPKTNEWKVRTIPILSKEALQIDPTGRQMFVNASLCGITPERESKTFGWAKKIIVT